MFLVYSYNTRDGKAEELREWLKKTGEPYLREVPEVKSVRSYFRQLGLGQRPTFQTWLEISNFASLAFLDRWRTDSKRQRIFKEWFTLVTDFNCSILNEL
jgi:hypothetical protein